MIYLIEAGHAAGPPFAQRSMVGHQGDTEGKVKLHKHAIGIA